MFVEQGCTFAHSNGCLLQDLSGDKACFCGGLVKFSQMLTVVEVLQCSEDQGRVSKLFFADLFNKETTTTTTTAANTTTTTAATTTTDREGRLFFPNAFDFNFGTGLMLWGESSYSRRSSTYTSHEPVEYFGRHIGYRRTNDLLLSMGASEGMFNTVDSKLIFCF